MKGEKRRAVSVSAQESTATATATAMATTLKTKLTPTRRYRRWETYVAWMIMVVVALVLAVINRKGRSLSLDQKQHNKYKQPKQQFRQGSVTAEIGMERNRLDEQDELTTGQQQVVGSSIDGDETGSPEFLYPLDFAPNNDDSNSSTKEYKSVNSVSRNDDDDDDINNNVSGGPDSNSRSQIDAGDSDINGDGRPVPRVNAPIFVASLFKSGTTTVHAYLKCGKIPSAHYQAKRNPTAKRMTRTGPCMWRNHVHNRPLFAGCGYNITAWSDNAYLTACFEPSIHGLDNIYKYYPNATIVLAHRDPDSWVDSVNRFVFAKWSLMPNVKRCVGKGAYFPEDDDFRDIMSRNVTEDDVRNFYVKQVHHVRRFASEHPSITFVEVALESDQAGQILQDKIGIPSTCWGHENKNKRHPSKNGKNKNGHKNINDINNTATRDTLR